MINASSNGRFECSCGQGMGLPTQGSRVTGLSCPNCPLFWEIKYTKSELLGRAIKWECPNCSSSSSICRRIPRWCPAIKAQ